MPTQKAPVLRRYQKEATPNMLPLAVFDGGRVFYLTILGIFKTEKFAKKAFVYVSYLIGAVFALLMVLWFMSFI